MSNSTDHASSASPLDVQETIGLLLSRMEQFQQGMELLHDMTRLQLADWLTIEHAARVCDCSYDHINRAVGAGELPASDIGNGGKKAAYRISRADLNAWMERNKGGRHLPPRSVLKEQMPRYLPGVD